MTPAAIRAAFEHQSLSCIDLGSPFMGQLMRLCAERDWPPGPVTDRVFAWTGDISPRGQSLPLRLAGVLHALHLNGDEALAPVYPPAQADDDALWRAVSGVLVAQAATIDKWLDSPPQTNEVRRAAVLIAVGHWLAERYGLPMRISELGASGGLNLNWDRYALQIGDAVLGARDPVLTLTPEWLGPLPPSTLPRVMNKAGVDLNPLDPSASGDALRLQAYLWPDQPVRLALTSAAISAATTKVDKGDAIDWLATRLAPVADQLHLIYSTIAWQYFPAAKQAKGQAMIAAEGKAVTSDAPLAWFGMENDGGDDGAALTLRLWPGNLTIALGRADFHGRWIRWTPPA